MPKVHHVEIDTTDTGSLDTYVNLVAADGDIVAVVETFADYERAKLCASRLASALELPLQLSQGDGSHLIEPFSQ
jgi:hypothetical protein